MIYFYYNSGGIAAWIIIYFVMYEKILCAATE